MAKRIIRISQSEFKSIVSDGKTAAGTRKMSIGELEALLPALNELGLFVQSMESFEIKSEQRRPLRVDLSILGLEKGYDERAKKVPGVAAALVREKIRLARQENLNIEFQIWLDELCP